MSSRMGGPGSACGKEGPTLPVLLVKAPGSLGSPMPWGRRSPSRWAQARASRSLRSRRHSRSPKPLRRCLARPTLGPALGPEPPPSSELAAESSSCCSPPREDLETGQREVRREPHVGGRGDIRGPGLTWALAGSGRPALPPLSLPGHSSGTARCLPGELSKVHPDALGPAGWPCRLGVLRGQCSWSGVWASQTLP